MARDLHEQHAVARNLFAEADGILGYSLSALCFEGPVERLSQTEITQPAVYVHSAIAHQLLAAAGVTADCVAGHSLGEYSAFHAAGVFDFAQGLRLVAERGRLMQEAGDREPGKMVAVVGLGPDAVDELCADVSDEVSIAVAANFNAPGQIVVSGNVDAVNEFGVKAAEAGAKRVVDLPVSAAFHSCLMAPAAEQMAAFIADAQMLAPAVPVVTNVAAQPVEAVDDLRRQLIDQMTSPVRWTQSVGALSSMGVTAAFEVGPGAVLKGLVRRITPVIEVTTAGTAEGITTAVSANGD